MLVFDFMDLLVVVIPGSDDEVKEVLNSHLVSPCLLNEPQNFQSNDSSYSTTAQISIVSKQWNKS